MPAPPLTSRRTALLIVAFIAASGAALAAMGRPLWCEAGDLTLWSGEIRSRHNSQHLADPYTLTHVTHGILYYWGVLWLLGRRLGGRARFVVAILIEAVWEVFENTSWVIERYRAETISLEYYGDSVLNSLGDSAASLGGYAFAALLPGWASIVGLLGLEVGLTLWIRDGLILNVLMLVVPSDAVRAWQNAGSPLP